ncbi:MAG: hypothetical protein JWM98_1462 [Thermoleophilia bacterium]|nr:hypothetical protein [Thermoleophilia bacterium]
MTDATPTLLVAGYDPDLRAAVTSSLARTGACRTRLAANGTAVAEAVRFDPPDAVVVDATRGDTLALAALRHLRGRDGRRGLPVVLLSDEEHSAERRELYAPWDVSGVVTTWRSDDLSSHIESLTGLDLTGSTTPI